MNNERELLVSLLTNREKTDGAFRRAVRDALLDHKRAGNPVAVWKDGRVVIVPPEEIVLPEEGNGEAKSPESQDGAEGNG